MGWVSAVEYNRSAADPLADTMAEIIQHMNADHKDALVLLAREFARIDPEEATMTAVDRLGFHVRLKTPAGMRGARIAFLREVRTSVETRKVLVEMVQQARQRPPARQAGVHPSWVGEARVELVPTTESRWLAHRRGAHRVRRDNRANLFIYNQARLPDLTGCHIHFFIAFRTVVNVFRHCVAAIATSPGKSVHPVGFRSTSVCLIVQTIPRSPYSFVRLE